MSSNERLPLPHESWTVESYSYLIKSIKRWRKSSVKAKNALSVSLLNEAT